MNEKLDLRKIEQQTFHEFMIDGITEILVGLVLLFVPVLFFMPVFVVFIPFFILFGAEPLIDFIRERTTYPRIGRVELKTELEDFSVKRSVLEFLMLILGAVVITFIAMFIVEGEITNLQLWYKWIPLCFGLIMFGPSLFLVEKTGQQRHYFLGVFTTIFGFFFSIIDFPDEKIGIFLFFFTLGIIAIIIGIVRYSRFIRKYPIIEVEEE